MFADIVRLLHGDIRELEWIMFRESAKTSIASSSVPIPIFVTLASIRNLMVTFCPTSRS